MAGIKKNVELIPVKTDKPLSCRLLMSIAISLLTFIAIGLMTFVCMKTLNKFDLDMILIATNIIPPIVVFFITFILESEGNYKIVEKR